MSGYLNAILRDVQDQWREKSKNQLYRTDPEAWLWDVLGYRWHKKQREFVHGFMDSRRIAVKSANGTGKSRGVGELITWGISVHEPGELLIITSAPTMRQIKQTTFGYVAANQSRMRRREHPVLGYLTDSEWNYREHPSAKSKTLVLGQKPADKDIVGSFQGIRSIDGDIAPKTWVFIDEAGAVHADLFIAAESVTTGAGDNKIMAIGNPDNLGTYFHRIFTDDKISQDWYTETLAAPDLPTFTGEVVYSDPRMQEMMLTSGMIDPKWVEHKKRAWGEESARYKSKVLGEFPDSDDFSFFSQSDLDKAKDTEIEPDDYDLRRLGVDVARMGDDESMAYQNDAGKVRKLANWSKATTNESASRIHGLATEHGVHEVIIDVGGVGAGVKDQVLAIAESKYSVIEANGSFASPNPTRWLNARAYWYDMFRQAIREGQIDLDPNDTELFDEMLILQFEFTDKGALKIESKKDMKKRGVQSPDAMDSAVYSIVMDLMDQISKSGIEKGDVIPVDSMDWIDLQDRAGLPI